MATTESTKKRTTEANTKKQGSDTNDPSGTKPTAPKSIAVVRRPAVQSSAETAAKQEVTPKKPTYEARMRELAPIVRLRRKLESTVKRFANVAAEVKRWKNAPELCETAVKIETALAAMLADAAMMPDTFQPERERKAGGRQLVPGAKVTLREKFVAKYDGVLEPAERTSLEVVAIARGHVSVKTAGGARIVLPRGHVAKVAVSDTPAGSSPQSPPPPLGAG